MHDRAPYLNSKYYIKLDDLIVAEGAHLTVVGWEEGRDFLLVRKSSQHLADALRKMEFNGYDRNNIHLEDYDSEYWSIEAAPEPAVCGAALGAAGLGLWRWRRRKSAAAQKSSGCA